MSLQANQAPAWATASGDVWAERWIELDRGLSGVADQLDPAILAAAPSGPFRAFDIGCGAGSTSLALAQARPDATIVACDLSPSLARIAEGRLAATSVTVVLGDAEDVAAGQEPFDLIVSRHGVMFFADPPRAFARFRAAASPGAKLVFSCFENWAANRWASLLAAAAAGHLVDLPRREPGGFAFADPDHVRFILELGGWTEAERRSLNFRYVAGSGEEALTDALSLLCAVGPASVVLRDLDGQGRANAVQRMGQVIERHFDGKDVTFPAVASIWTARA